MGQVLVLELISLKSLNMFFFFFLFYFTNIASNLLMPHILRLQKGFDIFDELVSPLLKISSLY